MPGQRSVAARHSEPRHGVHGACTAEKEIKVSIVEIKSSPSICLNTLDINTHIETNA